MNAEVIAIGDELTSGQRLDTNSQWLSQRLGEIGVRVLFHTTVADDLDSNITAFRTAADRADIVISTGGLGPTADDLTRQAIAAALERELVLDEPSLVHIQSLFAQRKRKMPERNTVQAMFPAGSRPIPNPHGTAPGVDVEVPRADRSPSRIFALPGVPAEMREMWELTILPALADGAGDRQQVVRHRQIKCFGVGESDLEQMLPDLIRRGRHPSVGITVSRATITLRVTATAESEQACFDMMQPTIDTIHECLGNLVFGEGDDELQHATVRLLRQHHKTLATIEWGTGGLIANWLGEVSGSGEVYRGGTVVSSSAATVSALQLAPAVVEQHHPASRHIAREMAREVRQRFGADYGLSVSEFPPAEAEDSAEGQFFIGLATPRGVIVKSRTFAGHPDILRHRSAKQALNVLRLDLLE